jgi:hypothetical protein
MNVQKQWHLQMAATVPAARTCKKELQSSAAPRPVFFPRVENTKRTFQLAFGFFKTITIFRRPAFGFFKTITIFRRAVQTMCASAAKYLMPS